MTDHDADEPIDAGTITRLLGQGRAGDCDALSEAWSLLYQELRRIAHNVLRGDGLERQVDATELIGSIWIREQSARDIPVDRQQFFGRAFRNMSRELVERARHRDRRKRGGGWVRQPIEVAEGSLSTLHGMGESSRDEAGRLMVFWGDLHEELPITGDIAFCRMVLGLTNEQTARLLDLPAEKAQKEWLYARARLKIAQQSS
ncbi:MAG: ECF-type sigma factor [Phycisphaerales bacterium]|nr:ECF-type sigma factor [Phycisphaerales bacterium]